MNYYLYINEQTLGPYPEEQLAQMLAAGQVTPQTPCCREGDQQWQTVNDFAPAQQPASGSSPPADRFAHFKYLIRRKIFSFMGAAFHIYGPDGEKGEALFYSKMKAFKLKEDIRLYTGEDMKTEILSINAKKIIDFSSAYDVVDSATRIKVGALKRKGLKSVLKDEWIFLDANDQEIGLVQEDTLILALLRRYVPYMGLIIPQTYHGKIGENPVCLFKRNFNPLVIKITLDFSSDVNGLLDRRLGVAAAILLCAIEGRE